jgi:asparagine synthase (glutamine-hydrolysing)
MQCPVGMKLNNLAEVLKINENESGDKKGQFFQKTNDGKQILREMMSRHIPENITRAEKQGFSSPDASWFKGQSIEFVKRQILDGQARIYDFLDRDTVQRLVMQHLNGDQNRRLLIWSLLNVEAWIQEYL